MLENIPPCHSYNVPVVQTSFFGCVASMETIIYTPISRTHMTVHFRKNKTWNLIWRILRALHVAGARGDCF